MSDVVAECYFLDVGQGAAHVIDLGDDSAIVIDCGRSFSVLDDLLTRRLRIRRIAALILTHNHEDHVGGVPGLLENYPKTIDQIFLLQSEPAKSLEARKAFSALEREGANGNAPLPSPLIRDNNGGVLYPPSLKVGTLTLELLFPNFFQNVHGQARNPNATSAVLILQCGDRRILFSGDAEIATWRCIIQERGGKPIECDVLSVPHHGGQIIRHKKPSEDDDEFHRAILPDLKWLYSDAIRAKTAILSVGTGNRHLHPLPPHVQAIHHSGACVMCTQITDRCSRSVSRLHPSVLKPVELPGHAQSTRGKSVACAGTVLVQIGPNAIRVVRQTEHQNAIDDTLTDASDHPLCRPTR